jgi:hypothetical protein
MRCHMTPSSSYEGLSLPRKVMRKRRQSGIEVGNPQRMAGPAF